MELSSGHMVEAMENFLSMKQKHQGHVTNRLHSTSMGMQLQGSLTPRIPMLISDYMRPLDVSFLVATFPTRGI